MGDFDWDAVREYSEKQLAEWEARVSEGHCADCMGRLRTLTPEEQVRADAWHREPFAVCTVCDAVHTRARDGQDLERLLVTGISWSHVTNRGDPFGLEGVRHGVG